MSSQTKNLKSQIIKEKIKRLGVLFFSLFLTLAVFSQISYGNANPEDSKKCDSFVENCKLKIENSASPSDWLYYKSSNDLSAYLGKKSSSLPTVRYQKGNDYLEFSMTGVSSTTSVSLETNVKTPNTPTLFYRNILDGADANYQITNIPFRVKEEIILKEKISNDEFLISNKIQNSNDSIGNSSINSLIRNSDLEIRNSNLTFLFSAETTAKPVKQDDGSIAFFDNQNNYLFQLDKPFMVDAKGNRSEAVTIEIISKSEVLISNQISNPNDQTNQNRHPMSVLGQTFDDNNQLFKQFKKFFPAWDFKNWNLLRNYDLEIRNFSNIRQNRLTMSVLGPQQYTLTLKADSEWLSQATYPVIIDPTVTHNADANFTGQMNRIADADTTSSTQLESSYPEATKDPYTVLLLHFNEANGTTAGIRDYASTTRVITANGNASTTSSVTQLGLGNSAAFDGTGDYFSMPDSEDWNFGAGDFSIDGRIRLNSLTSGFVLEQQQTPGDSDNRYFVYYDNSLGQLRFNVRSSAVNTIVLEPSWSPSINTWYYFVLIRSGNNFNFFINGSQLGATTIDTDTIPNFAGILTIGANYTGGSSFNGHLDELRIIKGRALTLEEIKAAASRRPYSVYTSSVLDASASVQWDTLNWTEGGVNTGDGETPYSTNSLVAQWNFNETSGTTLTASSSGSCTTACNGTLTNFAYTASQDQATTTTGWTANNKKWGAGALMFDGSNDYVSVGASGSTNLNFSGAATLEFWVKTNSDTCQAAYSLSDGTGNNRIPIFFGNGCTGYVDNELISTSKAKDSVNVYSTAYQTTNRKELIDGNWHHVAIIWDTIKTRIYLDGIERATNVYLGTDGGSYGGITGANLTELGRSLSASFVNGIIDSTRIYSRALSAAEILSNYNAGNIEIQTRTGATSDPNDGSWEAWKPTTGETQLLSMDSDAANWRSDIMASTTIATSTDTVIKVEGTGSLKIRTGMASTTAGAVALWHFEETGTTTGATLYDETANNRDLTTTGTLPADGIFGKARRFNGSSDYATVSSSGFPTGSASRTIIAWVKSEDCSNSACWVFGYGAGALGQTFGASGFPGGNWWFQGAGAADVDTGVAFVQNKWHHIAVSYDGATVRFYLNGFEIANGARTLNTGGTIFDVGYTNLDSNKKWKGLIDEMAVFNRVLSADEIAETYRMGANHHLTRQVSATDLSSANKLAFNVASDRPGTYLEAMLGESDYANYELASSTLVLSTNTVLYIKGDEIASSTNIKDSSFSGKAITANGNARTAGGGKIGNSVYFDGTGDYLTIPDSDDWTFGGGDFSVDFWIKFETLKSDSGIMEFIDQFSSGSSHWFLRYQDTEKIKFQGTTESGVFETNNAWNPSVNTWYHIAFVRNGSNAFIFINGISQAITTIVPFGNLDSVAAPLYIGYSTDTVSVNSYLNGSLDELRILKGTALSADQIRQAYEYGLRTHPITIDFGATLQSSDLISSATDYNFSLTATTSGLSATTSGLYLGDKIIIKENLGGTEYTAQGTVNAINTTTGAITVPSWDTGSTFPSGNGYSPNATVFKWQREYFDLTGAATTTRNAITNLTLRPTNGAEGRTIYLDDFRYNTNYLTASSSSAITSGNNRYLQYRAIFSSTDTFVSPFLSAINTLYTALATMFPPAIGVSGGGFLSF